MWPFTRTLSERYSKLVKLIKSIDSHFQITEDKEDSVRLNLPNYKGNQTMDFHIYLMEPFLCINYVTEIEGEKISTVNSYPQDMNQQDIFNAVMASNLDRIHQVMAAKNKEKESVDITIEEEETIPKEENKVLRIINVWPLLEFAKAHGKMQVGEFANKDTGEVFKACIFTKPDDGTRIFVAFSTKLGELTPKQIVDMKNELQVVQLESGNYSLCKIDSGWKDVDLEERLAEVTWTDEYGAEYSVDKKVLKRVPKEITDYSILEGTEIIGDAAFSNCQDIVYVSIPNSINKIGHYAFAVLMGYYYSVYHFVNLSPKVAVCVLLAPVLAHGIYDALAMSSMVNPYVGGVGFAILIVFCIKMHKRAYAKVQALVEKD